MRSPRHRARTRVNNVPNQRIGLSLSRSHHLGNGDRQVIPVCFFGFQLFAACGSEFVKPGATVVLRSAPFALDPAPLFDAVERWVQSSLFNGQHVFSELLYALTDAKAVHLAQAERLQYEHVQRPLRQARLLLFHELSLLLLTSREEGSHFFPRRSREKHATDYTDYTDLIVIREIRGIRG